MIFAEPASVGEDLQSWEFAVLMLLAFHIWFDIVH